MLVVLYEQQAKAIPPWSQRACRPMLKPESTGHALAVLTYGSRNSKYAWQHGLNRH